MTFFDFIKLVQHYLKLVIVIPVVCFILGFISLVTTPASYNATAAVFCGADTALVSLYVDSFIDSSGQEIVNETSIANKQVSVTAHSDSSEGAVSLANQVINSAVDSAKEMLPNSQFQIVEATNATQRPVHFLQSLFVAVVFGLIIAACLIIVIDLVRTPIKSRYDIERAVDVSVIGEIPGLDRGEGLLANLRFVCDKTPRTVCVVPVGLTGSTVTVARLATAAENAGIPTVLIKGDPRAESLPANLASNKMNIIECAPLTQGMGAAYLARDADVTLICAREWADSRSNCTNLVRELKLAQANIGGAVLVATDQANKTAALSKKENARSGRGNSRQR